MKFIKHLSSLLTTDSIQTLDHEDTIKGNYTVSHQKLELHKLRSEMKSFQLKIDELTNRLENKPQLVLSDEESVIISIPDFYLNFPKNQLNSALSYLDPQFDLGLRAFIYNRLTSGSTFIDIGANAGVISGIAAKIIGPEGTLISVEPVPSLESSIKQNVFLNSPLTKHEHLIAAAGGSKSKLNIQIFENDNRVSTLHFYEDEDVNDDYHVIEVDVVEASEIVPEDPENVFIKIDTEGSESEILGSLFKYWKGKHWINTIIIFEYANEHLVRAGADIPKLNEMLASSTLTIRRINAFNGLLEESITLDAQPADGNYAIFQE